MSELIRCGCDLVEISRLENPRDRLLDRLFDQEELALCGGRPESLAAFYAAKEAFAKALGCGLMAKQALSFKDVAIRKTDQGAPYYVWGERVNQLVPQLAFPLVSTLTSPLASSPNTSLAPPEFPLASPLDSSPESTIPSSLASPPASSLAPTLASPPASPSVTGEKPNQARKSCLEEKSDSKRRAEEWVRGYHLTSASLSLSHEAGLALAFAVITLQA